MNRFKIKAKQASIYCKCGIAAFIYNKLLNITTRYQKKTSPEDITNYCGFWLRSRVLSVSRI